MFYSRMIKRTWAQKDQVTPQDHMCFEFVSWYWHFVDIVWIFLSM
ncbi:cytochrome c oxidase subunit 3 [Wolbachia endosymbiont of Atemnus politus]